MLVLFLFETGARKAEALNQRWANVIFERAMILIWAEAPDADEELDEDAFDPKTREREVPASDHLLRELQRLKDSSTSPWVFPTSRRNNKGIKGEKYAFFPKGTWTRILAKANELAMKDDPNAPTIKGGPHKCRHTFASHFLAKKPDLFLLGRLLGHSHTGVTELYAHLLPDHLAEARNVVQFAPLIVVDGEKAAKAARRSAGRRENRAHDRAYQARAAAPIHGDPRNLVGAIGIEPTTPTVSRPSRPFRTVTRSHFLREKRQLALPGRSTRYAKWVLQRVLRKRSTLCAS